LDMSLTYLSHSPESEAVFLSSGMWCSASPLFFRRFALPGRTR